MARSREREETKRKRVSARKKAEQHESGGLNTIDIPSGSSLFQIKAAGSKRIDIIPYIVGEGNPYADEGEVHYERTYWAHRGVGPNNDTHTCLAKTHKKPCPVCEYRAKLAKEGGDEEVIKNLAPKERQLFNVFDRGDPDRGVQIWEYSYFLFGKGLDEKIKRCDEEDGYEYFADPEDGYTLKLGIVEEKMGKFPFYRCEVDEFKPRKEPISQELLDAALCLDELIKSTPYADLKKILLQTPDDDDDDDDKPKAKNRIKDDDEDDDEDEPQKPVKKGSASKNGKKQKTAKEAGLKVGSVVMYDGEECEVKRISPDGTSLLLENEDGDDYRAVGPEECEKVPTKDDEDDESPPPKKGGTKKPATKNASTEDEDDDEEPIDDEDDEDDSDEDDEDDDEEPKKPVKKATKKK